MAIHRDLSPTPLSAIAKMAGEALSNSRSMATAGIGSLSIRNADGTTTVIGDKAGSDATGTPNGIRQWVGDTTAPGRPTGISWLSVDGTVTGVWDGTIEGGAPADLDHVEMRAGDLVTGRLKSAGSCSVAAEVGKAYDCYAIAIDVSGNVSAESDHATVTCRDMAAEAQRVADAANAAAAAAKAAADKAQSDVDGASKSLRETEAKAQAAKDAAARAQSKAEGVASDLSATKATIEQHATELGELTTKVSGATAKADSALTASTEARQSATEATTKAESAYRDSQTALAQSTTATQTAAKAQTTAESAAETASDSLRQSSQATQTANELSAKLTTEYQTKADADKAYATQASLRATSESIASEVSKTYATKATVDALQNIADNAIESWRGTGVPTADNRPASDWTTAALKRQHNGDLYYDKSTGKAYRWGSDDGVTYTWELNQDSDVTKALQDASNAQASAEAAGTAASKAQDTADTATSKADAAQSSADTAKSAADSAASAASKAQGDVDRLKVDIPATYVTKSAFEQTSESITTSVTKAQRTADSAVTAASRAQQTAEGISATITKDYQTKAEADAVFATQSSLKATSETLTASVAKAQGTADGAVEAASKAQQTAEGISLNLSKNYSTTTEVNKKIDDISVGGRNYCANALMTPNNVTIESFDVNTGVYTLTNTNTWSGGMLLFKSKEYAAGIYCYAFENHAVRFVCTKRFDSTWVHNDYYSSCFDSGDAYVTNTYSYSGTFVATEPFQFGVVIEAVTSAPVGPIKLELGNKPTDWTPAPEDLQPAGDYATRTELKATSDSITATVSKTYATREQLSQVKQTADSLTTTIKSTVTGAKVEYALGTSSTTAPTSGWSTTAPAWQSGRYMWQRTTVTKQDGTSSTSMTCIQGAKGETGATGAAGPQGPKGDDFDGDARLSTIETLVRASGSGVEVAKKVNGDYASTKTLMDDTGFSVLDKAGNVLSKFTDKVIELGRNSKNAVIKLCGGTGSIRYSDGFLTIFNGTTEEHAATRGYVTLSNTMSSIFQTFGDQRFGGFYACEGALRLVGDTLRVCNSTAEYGRTNDHPMWRGWTNIYGDYFNDGNNGTSSKYVAYCVRMGVCWVQWYIWMDAGETYTCPKKLPEDCRPKRTFKMSASAGSNNNIGQIGIWSNGDVIFYSPTANALEGCVCFPIGD